MQLKSDLRKHYVRKTGGVWVPKRAFNTKEEIEDQLGFRIEECLYYTCTVCNKIHYSTPPFRKAR